MFDTVTALYRVLQKTCNYIRFQDKPRSYFPKSHPDKNSRGSSWKVVRNQEGPDRSQCHPSSFEHVHNHRSRRLCDLNCAYHGNLNLLHTWKKNGTSFTNYVQDEVYFTALKSRQLQHRYLK